MKRFIQQIDNALGRLYVPFVLLIMSTVLFVLGYPFVRQTTTQAKLNTVATQTIRANKTVEDTQATQKAREAAEKSVASVYSLDETVALKQIEVVTKFFEVITTYRQKLAEPLESGVTSKDRLGDLVSQFFNSFSIDNELFYNYAHTFSESVIKQLLEASPSNYAAYETMTKSIVQKVLKDNIYPTNSDLTAAKDKANSLILTQSYIDSTRNLVRELVNPAIVATMVVNEEATKKQVEQVKAQTPAVIITQGDVIVREGEVITQSIYHKLELLGMTNNQANVHTLLGYVLVLGMQFAIVWYFITHHANTLSKQNLYANMYAFLSILLNGLVVIFTLLQNSGVEYIALAVPLGIVPLVMIPKAKRRLSILLLCFVVMICFFIGDSSSTVQVPLIWTFYTFIAMISTVVVAGSKKKKLSQHFVVLLFLYVSFIFALAMYYNIDLLSKTFLMMLVYASANILVTIGMIRLGQPYFDLLFEDKAVLKMLELSNPNQPLLKELISKAPGTYHHSIMVANLSANAVEAIGGDSLFTRVACYYHDIGKLKNPMFFTENLPSGLESPHKLLTPQQSRDIIFEHVSEGVRRLTLAHLPQSIIDICQQHHGTTVMKYFYVMAKEKDDAVTLDDFRYAGPKPQTKESAVISIADSVEAAAKSMQNPTKDSITELVQSTIKSRILDGQFDEAPITMKELKIVEESLIRGLAGSYHTRVKYPKLREK